MIWPTGRFCRRHPDWAETFSEVWTPGEAAALERLEAFVEDDLSGYKAQARSARQPMARHGSRRIWPWAKSPLPASGTPPRNLRDVPADDVITFRKELVWRDFSYHLLFHNPDLPQRKISTANMTLSPGREPTDAFERWTEGPDRLSRSSMPACASSGGTAGCTTASA